MQSYWTRRYLLASCIFVLLFAAGCFQPAGANLEATSSAQAMPTFTPIPTDTPPPTNTPEPTATEEIRTGFATLEGIMPIASDTLDPQALLQGTSIAALPEQQSDIDDLIATATAMAQGQQPLQPQQEQPTATQDIDPLALTATMIVASATAAAGGQQPEATIAPGVTATIADMTPTATAAPTGSCVHTVVAGQNLFRISLQYNTTVDALAAANGIVNPNMIFVGQQITIPGCGTTTPPTGGTPVPGSGTIHTVVQGETLFEISLQYGVTVHDLAAVNGISNINLILIGQQIRIP
jgi:LysM repeat protein